MNLIIDVGNTFVKLAVFSHDNLILKEVAEIEFFTQKITQLRVDYPEIKKSIVSSVGELSHQDLSTLTSSFDVLVLNSDTRIPFKNYYGTPKTLGVDRIALVSASVKSFQNTNALIIDAGTCITFDFINSNNEYLGGAISPGLQMRYKALNTFTAKLPLLKQASSVNLIGSTTAESMHSGVINGIVNEIDGVVNAYKAKYSDLTVILTGGDSKFLSKQLKSSIFALPNFLLEGLNYILQFNTNE